MNKTQSFIRTISLAGLIAMIAWFAFQCAGCLAPGPILALIQSSPDVLEGAKAFPMALIFPLLRLVLYVAAYLILKQQTKMENPGSTALFAAVLCGIPVISLIQTPLTVLVHSMIARQFSAAVMGAYASVQSALSFTGVLHTIAICALLSAVSVHWAACSRE